jgi:ParB/RepB/Spo0J family partition protein
MDDTSTAPAPDVTLDHPGVGESGPTTTIPACPVASLRPAPWNPRKHFDEEQLATLATDIAAKGVLQPLVVRALPASPPGGPYEIVCGERRFRAAQRAGLAAVPVVVRVLDDREALECAISENGQRENLHPLEEADGFLALHTLHNESVEDIAARFGVSTKLVHQRLSLAKLCDEGRAAFLEGKLSWGTALRVARLTSLDHPREAVKHCTERHASFGATTTQEAARWIEAHFHLRLADAPFDTKAPDVLPGVGACTACPRNSDAQVPMFGDDVTPGQCMDPACFARKKEAAWQAAAAPAAQGRKVLTAEQSAAAAPYYAGGAWSGGYATPNDKPYELGGKKTLRQLLGANMPETVIARDREGKPVEVIPPDALKEALKKAGLGKKKKGGSAKGSKSAADYRAESEARAKVQAAVAQACRDALAKRTLVDGDRALWQFLALVVSMAFEDASRAVLERRNGGKPLKFKADDPCLPQKEETAALSPSGSRAFIFDVLIEDVAEGFNHDVAKALFAFLKVDAAAAEKRARAEIEAAKKKPAAVEAKPSGKKIGKAAAPAAKKAPAKPAAKKGGRK